MEDVKVESWTRHVLSLSRPFNSIKAKLLLWKKHSKSTWIYTSNFYFGFHFIMFILFFKRLFFHSLTKKFIRKYLFLNHDFQVIYFIFYDLYSLSLLRVWSSILINECYLQWCMTFTVNCFLTTISHNRNSPSVITMIS